MEKVPTSYQVSDSLETALPQSEIKGESGGKANYSVSMDSLNTGTPTNVDLTMEEAAEAGTGYLRDIFGLDLEGAYVYMSYCPGTETFPVLFGQAMFCFRKSRHLRAQDGHIWWMQ